MEFCVKWYCITYCLSFNVCVLCAGPTELNSMRGGDGFAFVIQLAENPLSALGTGASGLGSFFFFSLSLLFSCLSLLKQHVPKAKLNFQSLSPLSPSLRVSEWESACMWNSTMLQDILESKIVLQSSLIRFQILTLKTRGQITSQSTLLGFEKTRSYFLQFHQSSKSQFRILAFTKQGLHTFLPSGQPVVTSVSYLNFDLTEDWRFIFTS